MARIDKIKPGQILYDVKRGSKSKEYWPVEILEVDLVNKRAKVSWNGNINRPQIYGEHQIKKLRYKEPE